MATDNVSSGQNVGKTIGQLQTVPPSLLAQLPNFYMPAEFGEANYRVTPGMIAGLVTASSVGLGNVDNTSDLNKPVSNAVASLLTNYWNKNELIQIGNVENLFDELDGKRSKAQMVPLNEVAGLQDVLATKMDLGASIGIDQVTGLQALLDNKSNVGHTHELSELDGWSTFLTGLQQSLSIRPTFDQVQNMIDQYGGGLSEDQVTTLIEQMTGNFVTQVQVAAQITTALDASGFVTLNQVNDLIGDALSQRPTEAVVSGMIDQALANAGVVAGAPFVVMNNNDSDWD